MTITNVMYACGGQASISNVKMWMCIYFELCLDSQQHMIELESEVAFIKLSQLLAARAIDELKSIEEKVQGRLTEQPQPVKIIITVSMIMNQKLKKQKRHYPINANQGHQWGCLGGGECSAYTSTTCLIPQRLSGCFCRLIRPYAHLCIRHQRTIRSNSKLRLLNMQPIKEDIAPRRTLFSHK